jgi:flagellar hook-length control protein FliK
MAGTTSSSTGAVAFASTGGQAQAGGEASTGGQDRAGADSAAGGPALASRTAGSGGTAQAAATAAQPGAIPGVFSAASSAAASSEASPLPVSAAAAQLQPGAATASSSAGGLSATGVGLQDMIESIHATIEIAARQGATQARIALQPEDLGHISIRLSQTSEGLLARVSAETPAAAQALVDGRAELHQSLSSLGLPLLRLDISSFGQSQTGAGEGRFAGDTGSSGSGAGTAPEEIESAEAPGEHGGAAAPAAIAGGALVDVLA